MTIGSISPHSFSSLMDCVEAIDLTNKRKEPQTISPALREIRKRSKKGAPDETSQQISQIAAAAFLPPIQKIALQIKNDPRYLRYHMQFWAREKRGDILIAIWNQFAETLKDDFEVLRELGEAFYSFNQLGRSLFFLSEALKVEPNSLSVLSTRAKIYAMTGQFDKAEEDFKIAFDINRSTATFFLGAYIFWLKKDYKTVLLYLTYSRNEIGASPHLFSLLNTVIKELDNSTDLERRNLRAMIDPLRPIDMRGGFSPPFAYDLPFLTQAAFEQRPLPNVGESACAEVGEELNSIRFSIQFWTRTGNRETVRAIYQKCQKKIDQNAEILSLLAHFFSDQGDIEEALLFVEKALLCNPNLLSLPFLKTQLLIRLGRLDEAKEALRPLLLIDDGFPSRYLTSLFHATNKDYKEIPDCLTGIADQIPFSMSTRSLISQILERIDSAFIGMPPEADDLLEARNTLFRLTS